MIYHVNGLEELILLKLPCYPRQATDSAQSPLKLPMAFFTELEQIILKFVWKQKDLNSQNNLEKEEWSWRNHTAWIQTILQIYCNQNSSVLAQKETHQWNRIENQEVKPHIYGQFIYDKGSKNIQWGKDNLFNK